MRKVRCHECGKTYDFDTDDFCPKCGAFTHPLGADKTGGNSSSPADDKKQRSEMKKELLFKRKKTAESPSVKKTRVTKLKEDGSGDLAFEILGEVLDVAFDLIDP